MDRFTLRPPSPLLNSSTCSLVPTFRASFVPTKRSHDRSCIVCPFLPTQLCICIIVPNVCVCVCVCVCNSNVKATSLASPQKNLVFHYKTVRPMCIVYVCVCVCVCLSLSIHTVYTYIIIYICIYKGLFLFLFL